MSRNIEKPLGNELLEGIPKYINPLRLSASRLSSFDREGPRTLIQKSDISGEAIDFGSIVDAIVSESSLKEYHICDVVKPTASLLILAEHLLKIKNNYESTKVIFDVNFVVSQIKELSLWSKIVKPEVLISKFNSDEFWNYLYIMIISENKTLIPTELYNEAKELSYTIKNHHYTKKLFNITSDEEILYQVKAEFEYNHFNFLSYLDIIKIDHLNKTIKGIDLKTGSNSAQEFMTSFIKYRYYIQGSLYLQALNTIIKDLGLEGYEILPFEFLYIGRFQKQPLLYTLTDKWVEAAYNGFTTRSGYNYRGINELLELIDWHVTTSIYNESKYIYDNNGNINLEDNFITVNE